MNIAWFPVLCILLAACPAHAAKGDDVAICLVVKDQNDDILEFIDYHRWIGVGHFYIYDNNSTQPMEPILQEYYDAGLIDYTNFAVKPGLPRKYQNTAQGIAYTDCIKQARAHHKWLAFIDADEFLFIKDLDPRKQRIDEFLKDYESFGGLGVNWLMFGSNGLESKPVNSTLTSYTKCIPYISGVSRHIKTIANTKYVDRPGCTPHHFEYKPGSTAVNERKRPIKGPFSDFSGHHIVLLHYAVKSKQEFLRKVQRGAGGGPGKKANFLTRMDQHATATCLDAVEKGRQFEACCFAGAGALRPIKQRVGLLARLVSWWYSS